MPYNPTPNLPAGQLYNNGAVRFDTRQLANQLYQEQRMRQAQQQQQSLALQKMMQEEMGKVRSADTQAITEKYNNYARLGEMLYDKKINRDPMKRNEIQMLKDRAYSDLMGGINGSIQLKDREKMHDQAYLTNPDNYSDDYNTLRSAMRQTQFDKVNNVMVNGKKYDLSSDEPLRYNGSNFNLGEIEQKAEGQLRDTGYKDTKKLDDKGLQFEDTRFQFGNNPQAYKDYYISALHERKAGRAAAYAYDQLPQGEMQKTIQEFKQIAPDKWKKMGIDPQDLNSSNPENKAENWATYRAMRYAIDKNPVAQKPERYTNEAMKMQLDEAKDKRMANFKHNLREGEIKLAHTLKTQDEAGQKASVESWLQKSEIQARSNPENEWTLSIGGKNIKTYEMPSTPSMDQAFEKLDIYGKKIRPNLITVDENGNYYPVYFKRNIIPERVEKQKDPATGKMKDVTIPAKYEYAKAKGKDKYAVDMELTGKSVPRNVLSPEVANVLISPKGAAEELDATPTGAPQVSAPATIDANYFLNLK